MSRRICGAVIILALVGLVSFGAAAEFTEDDLTWSNADPAGDEWSRAGNWFIGPPEDELPPMFPPANPTPGTFTFPLGGTSTVDQSWTIGGLRAFNWPTEGAHTVELGGNTLTVLGTFLVGDALASYQGVRVFELVLENGNLQIGQAGTPQNLELAGNSPGHNEVSHGILRARTEIKYASR